MNTGATVFRQLLQFFPRHEFNLCVRHYRGDYRYASMTVWQREMYRASFPESVRQVEQGLASWW